MRTLHLIVCLIGVAISLCLVSYIVFKLTTSESTPNLKYTCQNESEVCQTRVSCNTSNLTLKRCKEGDDTLVCCPLILIPELLTVPGEKALEMCKEYSKAAVVRKEYPIRLGNSPVYVDEYLCKSQTAIVRGGIRADEAEFPHMVNIGRIVPVNGSNEIHWYCGGSLISNSYVLTAAHCRVTIEDSVALIGRNDITEISNEFINNYLIPFDEWLPYPEYNGDLRLHDIALLKLAKNVTFSRYIRPICLNTLYSIGKSFEAIITGWGYNNDLEPQKSLQKADVKSLEDSVCVEKFHKYYNSRFQFCVGAPKSDSCAGDSGGPLQISHKKLPCMYTLLGVTSYGVTCSKDKKGTGSYTRVSQYIPWIVEVVWPS